MSLSIAIVGLPNVGKSTLFNALLKEQAALAANYPFATIEPNVGIVPVPDPRLAKLAEIVHTTVIKPATVEFVDVAGLVKGASKGEGLGNQFLSHIRETAAICHVVRAFSNPDIIREGSVSPVEDLAIVRTELQLADLATLEKQQPPKGTTDKVQLERWKTIELFRSWVSAGVSVIAGLSQLDAVQASAHTVIAKELALLTAKPELIVVNVGESDLSESVSQLTERFAQELQVNSSQVIVMCNQIESELSALPEAEQLAYLQELGLAQSGLDRLITAAYTVLGLQSFLTAGELEVKAWTIARGTTAPLAAGVIHTDFAKKFISAKVADYLDFVALGGWKALRDEGKVRQEGRNYVMRPGDIVEFMIGS